MAALCLCVTMLMCAVTAGAKDRRTIVRGMTKQEVTAVMGKPRAMGFNEFGEWWEYVKTRGGLLALHNVLITVEFGPDKRVERYSEKVINGDVQPAEDYVPTPLPGTPRYGYDGMAGYRFMEAQVFSENEFSRLYRKIKSAAFTDNKLDLIEVAVMKGYCTSGQCVQLLGLFSFSDDRLRALTLLAPHIIDPYNNYEIFKLFTFDSDKDKAARILQRR